jgi:hypothetical protein
MSPNSFRFCGMTLMETITLNYVEKKRTVFAEVNANTLSMQDGRRNIMKIDFD